MFGGGGGGKQASTTESSYPPEFRPLAESARKEIESLQQALPLASFAPFQPAGVAGLSPMDQWTMDLVTRTPDLPAAFEGLMQLPQPVGAAARGAVGAGTQTQASREAMEWIRSFLAGKLTVPEPALAGIPAPAAWSMPAPTQWPVPSAAEMAFPSFAPLARPETAFGGQTPSVSSLITQPTPYAQPIPSAPAPPPPPAPVPPPPGPAPDAAALTAAISSQVARMSLTPYGFQYYESLIALGATPEQALQGARNEELQVNPPNPSPGGD